jgi:pyridoxine/pyridoxamine 5'-phosphate oxidase
MTTPTPSFYNDLDQTLIEIRQILEQGACNRRAAGHHPVVATIGNDGVPSQRVMILRQCDWDHSSLRFHTDMRSKKVDDLAARQSVSVLIYGEPDKLQLRLTGTAQIESARMADRPWAQSTPFARRCYMAQAAPGSEAAMPTSGLPAWIEGKKPDEEQLLDARQNFAVLTVHFSTIDWLYLANEGHRRAKFERNGDGPQWTGRWLIP